MTRRWIWLVPSKICMTSAPCIGRARRIQGGGHEREIEALVVDGVAAEGLAFLGIGDGVVEGALSEARRDRRNTEATRVQSVEFVRKALSHNIYHGLSGTTVASRQCSAAASDPAFASERL